MKKHNFLHRGIGWVERELEATLAILILLAAVVGYTLAGTEAVTSAALTAQDAETSAFTIGTTTYSTLSFDPAILSDTNTYRVRRLTLTPSSVSTLANKGMAGTVVGEKYTASIKLGSPFSGAIYAWGNVGGISLNGINIVSSSQPVVITGANELTLNFVGGTHSIRALSINPPSAAPSVSADTVATLAVLPSTTKMLAGESRRFVVIATDQVGSSISSSQLPLKWSLATIPNGIATINQDGLVTTTEAGVITVKVTADGKSASASITVVPEPVAVTPATTTPSTTTPTATTPTTTTDDTSKQTLLDAISNILAGPASASTTTPAPTTITPSVATTTLFSDAAVIARVEATNSTVVSQAELNTVTTGMTATQKAITKLQVGFNQIINDFKQIAVGTKIFDSAGKVVVEKPSAIKTIITFFGNLLGGAKGSSANPLGSSLDEEETMQ